MKLFTSLAATVALTKAQDLGFGDFNSLADLFASLNAGDLGGLGDLGAIAGAGNDATVNATDGEFDPITGERYLIAAPEPVDDNTFDDESCTGTFDNTVDANCNPCVFDPSVCNFSPSSCIATDEDTGERLGPNPDNPDEWLYHCDCRNHDGDHNDGTDEDTIGWAGPDCYCTICNQYDATADASLVGADRCNGLNVDNPCEQTLANPNIDDETVCNEVHDNNEADYSCDCDDGHYGDVCNDNFPCGVTNGFEGDGTTPIPEEDVVICNGADGYNVMNPDGNPATDDSYCTCTCSTLTSETEADDKYTGDYCQYSPCNPNHTNYVDLSCQNGGTQTVEVVEGVVNAECACDCPTNYSGASCGTNDCVVSLGGECQNGGSMNMDDCTCTCVGNWTGNRCQTAVVVGDLPEVDGCWKCDAMTYVQCATEGEFTQCSDDNAFGDNGVCFIEYREQNQQLTQLCTGCKDARSCDDLKRQNFVPGFSAGNTAPYMRMRNQCKPDYRLQVARRRYGNTQSVCRQCFNMCSNDSAANAGKCFGGLGHNFATMSNDEKIGAAMWLRYYDNVVGQSPWTDAADQALRDGDVNANQAMVLGIPLMMIGSNDDDKAMVDSPNNHVFRGYTKEQLAALPAASGNTGTNLVGPADDGSDRTYPLFWALADSTDYFWSDNLIDHQIWYNSNAPATDVDGNYAASMFANRYGAGSSYDPSTSSKHCELDYGVGNYCDRN